MCTYFIERSVIMAKKHVFVSFDYTEDKHYKFLLEAWDANKNMDFLFTDFSSDEINTDSVSVVKANLTKRIQKATYTLVIVGKDSTKQHPDHKEIGFNNWQSFEIQRSIDSGNKIVIVKIDSSYKTPKECYGINAKWAYSFTQENIIKALNDA